MHELSDWEIDRIVQAFIDPPPAGFTASERKEWLDYMRNPKFFDKMPVNMPITRKFFTYEDEK